VRSYEHERTRSKRKLVARCDFDLVNDACAIHEGSIGRSEIPQKPATIDMTKKRVPCRNGRITHDQIARVKASDQDLRAHRQNETWPSWRAPGGGNIVEPHRNPGDHRKNQTTQNARVTDVARDLGKLASGANRVGTIKPRREGVERQHLVLAGIAQTPHNTLAISD
jgi:hypothetical protein